MFGLKAAAEAHRRQFEALLAETGESITLRFPAPHATTGGNDVTKMLGQRQPTASSAIGVTLDLVAIVSGPASAGTPDPTRAPAMGTVGLLATSDLVLRVRLSDALVDAEKRHGKTLFETAKDVQVQGSGFKLVGVERGGLAPLGPYILWVGLKALGT